MAGQGPAQLNEDDKIPYAIPNLSDLFFFANPITGQGATNTIQALLSLLSSTAPVAVFADIDALLANATIPERYFALVMNAVDDVEQTTWALYIYTGSGSRDNLASYLRIASGAGATSEHFKGVFANEAALEEAFPEANPGDYAYIDAGVSSPVELWIWDNYDETWIQAGGTIVSAWTDSVAGVVERSAQAEAEAIATQIAAGVVGSLSDARTPSEAGLYYFLVSLLTKALTWAAKQTFTSAPRFSSTTASQFLKVDSSKDLVSVGAASQAEMITGTDDTKPVTAKSVEDKGSVKLRSISNSATGTNDIDCQNQNMVNAVFTTALTGANQITWSNANNLQVLNIIVPVTGSSIAITVPSSTRMARQHEVSSGPGWNQSSKILTVSAVGTADLFELSFKRASTDGTVFILVYEGPIRA